MSIHGVFFVPYFPAFGLNMERYGVNTIDSYLNICDLESISLYSVRMWENADKKKLRIWTTFTQYIIFR